MKTSNYIFAFLFTLIGLAALNAALNGATHQWAIAAISLFMTVGLLTDPAAKPSKTTHQ